MRVLARRVVRDHDARSSFGQAQPKGASIVGLIGQELSAGWCAGEQIRRNGDVSDVPWAQAEGERAAVAVDNSVDLGGSTAAGATDRLYCRPPFPPAEARCALTAELSIMATSVGTVATSA